MILCRYQHHHNLYHYYYYYFHSKFYLWWEENAWENEWMNTWLTDEESVITVIQLFRNSSAFILFFHYHFRFADAFLSAKSIAIVLIGHSGHFCNCISVSLFDRWVIRFDVLSVRIIRLTVYPSDWHLPIHSFYGIHFELAKVRVPCSHWFT